MANECVGKVLSFNDCCCQENNLFEIQHTFEREKPNTDLMRFDISLLAN